MIVLWQVLKQLPNVVAAFKDYQEGMLARQNRKRIKQEMKQEEALQRLKGKRFDELVTLVNTLLTSEHKHLNAPIRFARTRVISVTIKIKDKTEAEISSQDKFDYTRRRRKIALDDEEF